MMYTRPRILRRGPAIRAMVRETILTPADFIAPLFIEEGEGSEIEIPSLPGYYRRSLDLTIKEVQLYSQAFYYQDEHISE